MFIIPKSYVYLTNTSIYQYAPPYGDVYDSHVGNASATWG